MPSLVNGTPGRPSAAPPVNQIYTKQHQIDELLKCGSDPIYFIKTYCKIQHPKRGLIPFALYPFQDECLEAFVEHRFNIVLKARQLGLTTVTSAYALWLALFHKHQNILVIATKRSTAMNFIKKFKVALRSLPKWMMVASIVADNKQEVEFSHGSSVKAIPTSDDAGRTEALSLLICDEAAWIHNFGDLWTGLYPTVSEGGRCIIMSTPAGVGNQYHKLYTDAELGINDFHPIFLPWHVHPEHDQAWFDSECKQLGTKAKIAQELLGDFVASGDTFLSMDDLEWIRSTLLAPIERQYIDRNLWVWKNPEPYKKYIISADVARGDAADFSAFHVINVDDSEVVAEYKGRIPPDELGKLMAEVGTRYNTALLCPENNTFGYTVLVTLRDLKYRRVYKDGDRNAAVIEYSPINDDIGSMGFNTNGFSRLRALSKLEEVLRNKQVKVHSSRLHDELKSFVWNGTKASAMKGAHDDLVISLAIGLWLYDVSSDASLHDVSMQNSIVAAMGVSSTTIDGTESRGLFAPGSQMTAAGSTMVPVSLGPISSNDMRQGVFANVGGSRVDFSWVLEPTRRR